MASFSFFSVFLGLPLFILNNITVFFKTSENKTISRIAKRIETLYERLRYDGNYLIFRYGISYGKASKAARLIKEKCLDQQYEYSSRLFEKEEALMNFLKLIWIIGALSFTITNSAIYLIILKSSDQYKKTLSSPLLPYLVYYHIYLSSFALFHF